MPRNDTHHAWAWLMVCLLIPLVAGCQQVNSRRSGDPDAESVLPAVTEPEGILNRLSNGTAVGGRPSMPAQTRRTDPPNLSIETMAENLRVPWDLEFTRDGTTLYFTQRPGSLWRLDWRGADPDPRKVLDRPDVIDWGESGLMGLALHPQFQNSGWLYLCETTGTTTAPRNQIVRVRHTESDSLEEEVLVGEIPAASYHDGCRLEFGPDGFLYATTGDAGEPSSAQDLSSWAGKILRMTPGGTPAPGNPFDGQGARPYVYSYGHRNPQGLAWDPRTQQLFASEHGPTGEFGLSGNDEVNRIVRGGNYGWPRAVGAPGVNGYRDPLLLFPNPNLPPAGMAVFPETPDHPWSHQMFLGSLAGETLLRVQLSDQGTVTRIERWFERSFHNGTYGRIRAVTVGPEPSLVLSTSNRDGRGSPASNDDRILKLTPQN